LRWIKATQRRLMMRDVIITRLMRPPKSRPAAAADAVRQALEARVWSCRRRVIRSVESSKATLMPLILLRRRRARPRLRQVKADVRPG
jgi:hypothetical protein